MPTLSASPARMYEDIIAPTVNQDSSQGYEVGNWWHDTVTDFLYQCINTAVGAAVWQLKPSEVSGTFIPVLQFGGATTGITYAASGQTGLYKKSGNIVYINVFIQLTSKGSASGNAVITGLPFTTPVSGLVKGLAVIKTNTALSLGYTHMYGRVNANSSQISLVEASDVILNTLQNATNTLFANNSIMQIDGFYFI